MAYARLPMIAAPDADQLNRQGLSLAAQGRDDLALRAWRMAAALSPDFMAAIGNLANLETRRQAYAPAIRLYRRGLALAPQAPPLLLMLATATIHSGAPQRASATLRRALVLAPAYVNALANLGTLLSRSAPIALALFRRALAVEPAAEPALAGAIRTLVRDGQLAPALPLCRRALAAHPASPNVLGNIAQHHAWASDVNAAQRLIRRAVALDPNSRPLQQQLIFTLVLDPESRNDRLFAEYRRWANRHAPATAPIRPPIDRGPERVLNVGYLSADFYDHPIAYLIEDLIAHHDRSRVRPFLFAAGDRHDATSRRLAQAARSWQSVTGLSDAAAARLIAENGIDILVVLAGHTGDNRVLIAGHRPAPVQVNLHDISTSGLAAMDYWLTDRHLHPEGTSEGHTEALWRLDSLYLHRWPEQAPASSPPPALQRGFVSFGSFANPAKINDRALALWARILDQVPGSRLRLAFHQSFADPLLRENLRSRLGRNGIARDRIGFELGRLSRAGHLARVASTDIALDPFPFTGGTATFEALCVGVPVITLAGERFAARCGVSHLAQVGLEDLIGATEDDYVRAAARLAQDLSGRTRASALCDAPRYARAVEAAYRDMWRRWCARG
jgi:predicted O-linked N-acetylglucosamine transferase (SPINDLY family)